MIRFVTPDLEPFLQNYDSDLGIFSDKIYAQYQTYGAQSGIVEFWIVWDGSAVAGLLSKLGGQVTLAVRQSNEELARFICALGCSAVEGLCSHVMPLLAYLPGELESAGVLRWAGASSSSSAVFDIRAAFPLRPAYELVCGCDPAFAQAVSYETWLTELSHKTRHGLAEVYLLYADQIPVSTQSILFKGKQSALIAGVATHPACRGQGYAAALLSFTAKAALVQSLCPYVLAADDGLVPFYSKHGYQRIDDWAYLHLQ